MKHLKVLVVCIFMLSALCVNADEDLEVKVTVVGGDTLVLDAGSSQGLKTGLRGRVYYKLTIGNEVRNIYIAKIVLTKVDTNMSTAKVEAKTKDLEAGLLVEIEGIQTSMVLIPAGAFQMGSNTGDNDEKPVHTVYVDAFHIDKREVTNSQYAEFLNQYGRNADRDGNELLDVDDPDCLIEKVGSAYQAKPGYEDHPVIEVTWYGASTYAKFHKKRLPTEAEWEKAARGGLIGRKYPRGDIISHNDANYSGTGGKDRWNETSPVGSFASNGYGLYDMSGNVWEWCSDKYAKDYYIKSPAQNPRGPSSGDRRVVRGGSWYYSIASLRCANRNNGNPTNADNFVGFRCAD